MRCARPDCRRAADVVVDFGAGLLVLLCASDAVLALVADATRRITRALVGACPDVTIPPREA